MSTKALRLGRISFLNVFPMHWALDVEPTFSGVPAEVNAKLVAREVDLGCVSSITYARHADDLLLLPSMCISAEGAVGSIFAIGSTPFEQCKRIYATTQSRTSVALITILCRLAGADPEVVPLEGSVNDHINEPGALVLLIGDDALKARNEPALSTVPFRDLGELWTERTGLPMVYAVWAVRTDAIDERSETLAALDASLVNSVESFRSSGDEGIAAAAQQYNVDPAAAAAYFDGLCYNFGPRERKGLVKFFELAHEHGLLDARVTPRFAFDPVNAAAPTSDMTPEAAYVAAVGSSAPFKDTPADREAAERALATEAAARDLDVDTILDKALAGTRIDDAEAVALLLSRRLLDVGRVADELRGRASDPDVITYVVDRNINYTNYCVTDCGFCAFYRTPGGGASDGYLHSTETILEKIQETVDIGGTAALLQGGHNPDLAIDYYVDLFTAIKERFPRFHLHALSPPEIQHIARRSKLSINATLTQLRDAGLDSLPGGGGEVLVDRVRRVLAPKKTKTDDWLGVMREAQHLGMSTTATMMYGHVELLAERVEHMRRVRELQDETHGFRAFISWTFQPGETPLAKLLEAGKAPYQEHFQPRPTPFDYLLTQAVSRIYLDNVTNIQSSWVTQGLKVGQVALDYGANDLGSIMIEENVVSSAGTTYRADSADFTQLIEAMGKRAVQRDTLYRPVNIEPALA